MKTVRTFYIATHLPKHEADTQKLVQRNGRQNAQSAASGANFS